MKKLLSLGLLLCSSLAITAQNNLEESYNQIDENGTITNSAQQRNRKDSLHSDKEIPVGMHVWTIDERFGDRTPAVVDTLQHMYMNTTFTTGLRGEYNTTGNLGSPRIARIFIDRKDEGNFLFTNPYDFIVSPLSSFQFTNTLSPITNVTLNSCGNRTNGEDDFKAMFATNIGKEAGIGFKFDYLYGRGYYNNQSAAHFKYSMWGSYIGDRYQAHLLFNTLHQKNTESGGIASDDYITHPEKFSNTFDSKEVPTILEQNWNKNDNNHILFSQRYNIGFNRKVKMTADEIKAKKFAMASAKENEAQKAKEKARRKAVKNGEEFDEEEYDKEIKSAGRPDDAKIAGAEPEAEKKSGEGRIAINSKEDAAKAIAAEEKAKEDTMWLKNEYVPVTSFIHTAKFENYKRDYLAYATPSGYYANNYYNRTGVYSGDSILDRTRHFSLKNTFAIALLEGFQKWMKAGMKAFVSYDWRHYELPQDSAGVMAYQSRFEKYNEGGLSVGGQISRAEGTLLHFNATGEFGVTGEDLGTFKIDGNFDVNIPFLNDTLQIAGNGFFHNSLPSFYYRHYKARHFNWNNDFDKIQHSRIMGVLTYPKTKTTLRVAVDNIKNHTYFGLSYNYTETVYSDKDKEPDYSITNVNVTPKQESENINIFTAQLEQNFKYGIFNWENVITYQKSSKQEVIPVPDLNIYSNLYLKFNIAKVLNVDLGFDVRYFTKYEAPEYAPGLGQYAVQNNGSNNTEVGNYPLINAYANFFIKHARFFVMMSNVNSDFLGDNKYFFTPHYPLNTSTFRFGVSWNFFN